MSARSQYRQNALRFVWSTSTDRMPSPLFLVSERQKEGVGKPQLCLRSIFDKSSEHTSENSVISIVVRSAVYSEFYIPKCKQILRHHSGRRSGNTPRAVHERAAAKRTKDDAISSLHNRNVQNPAKPLLVK